MIQIFVQVIPFFLLIGVGYLAVYSRLLSQDAIGHITRFVFYFPLSAMLFQFASQLPIASIFDPEFIKAYTLGTVVVYLLAFIVAKIRGCALAEASVEAQCSVIGNAGFLAIPMLVSLFGKQAAAPILLVLTVDLMLFGSLIVAIITGSRDGKLSLGIVRTIFYGLLRNPMIMALLVGLLWSVLSLPVAKIVDTFLTTLAAAATPCALFAIGGSLAARSAERLSVALWLSFAKLVLHPIAVGVCAILLFDVNAFYSGIMIATAAMPVAGNIYIVAQQYKVAPQRASASILVSTIISMVTLTAVIGLISVPV